MRVYAIGDSHMQALGPRLAAALGPDFDFKARPGASTLDFAGAAVPAPYVNADLIIVELGGNDRGEQGAARAALIASLRAQAPGARILWVGPAAARSDTWTSGIHNIQADSQAAQLSDWMDSRPVTGGNWRDDGVHFTPEGYDRWAAAIAAEAQRRVTQWWPWAIFGVGALGFGAWLLRR